ncbi:MAG: hypothetical protein R6U78_10560, partial [Bacteroidales bacterium]
RSRRANLLRHAVAQVITRTDVAWQCPETEMVYERYIEAGCSQASDGNEQDSDHGSNIIITKNNL